MNKARKWAVTLSLVMALLAGQTATAGAAGTVTYLGGAEKFLFAPGSGYSATDLFTSFKEVMPGDKRTGTVAVRNSGNTRVRLYLRALGAQEQTDALLKQMHLTVEAGGEILSSSSADSPGGLAQWTLLGTFAPGAVRELKLTLEMPLSADNSSAGQIGLVDWQLQAEEVSENPNPTTGDDGWLLWGAGLLLCGGGSLGLYVWRRKEKGSGDE